MELLSNTYRYGERAAAPSGPSQGWFWRFATCIQWKSVCCEVTELAAYHVHIHITACEIKFTHCTNVPAGDSNQKTILRVKLTEAPHNVELHNLYASTDTVRVII